jgi:hypothetical protein
VPDLLAAVCLVAHDPVGPQLGAATSTPLHGAMFQQGLKDRRLMLLSRCQEQRHELALSLGTEMDFGAEAALAPA